MGSWANKGWKMCFSAMVEQDFKKLGIKKGDWVDLARFRELIYRRSMGENLYIPKALEENFLKDPQSTDELEIQKLILQFRLAKIKKEEEGLFKFKKRLADAERKLKLKTTKGALNEKEVCQRQIERTLFRLEKLQSKELSEGDRRIFPMGWAPMIIRRDGKRVVVPARYHLRPEGQDESFDRKYDGNYNARRENLEKVAWWKNIFGKNHGVFVVHKFFENVAKHKFERRDLKPGEKEENVVLEFTPSDNKPMYIAVIYDQWPDKKEAKFFSAAAITMEPPPEIAETGHERCIIPIPEEMVDAWLEGGKSLQEYYDILDKRLMPFYKNRVAA